MDFEDRLLSHLQIVIVQRFRRNESLVMSWLDAVSVGDGRSSLWLTPTLPVYFKFAGSRVPSIDQDWLDRLSESAASSRGLILTTPNGELAQGDRLRSPGLTRVGRPEHNEGMTRFGIDALTALRLIEEGITVPEEHQLVAPNGLRSEALSILYARVRRGELAKSAALGVLDGVTSLRIRLLGDRVSRAVAWKIAEQLGWDDIARAEYVAVAQLQADALVTLDPDLARAVGGIVTVAPFEALTSR